MGLSVRARVTVALAATTVVGAIISATLLVNLGLRFGPVDSISAVGEIGFVPASDGRHVVYSEGCPNPKTETGRDGSIHSLCKGDAIGIVDMETGRRTNIPLNESVSDAAQDLFYRSDPYLVEDGRWIFGPLILDLLVGEWRDAPWPSIFLPLVRNGTAVYGASFMPNILRYDLDGGPDPDLLSIPAEPECVMQGLLRATNRHLLYAGCGGGLWLGVLGEGAAVGWVSVPLPSSREQFLSEAKGRFLADVTATTIILAANDRVGGARVYGLDVRSTETLWERKLKLDAGERVTSLFARDGQWVASYSDEVQPTTDQPGQPPTKTGYVRGLVSGEEIRRVEFEEGSALGRTTTRAFPVRDSVIYDEGGQILLSRPGQIAVSTWAAIVTTTIAAAALSLSRLPVRRHRAKFSGTGCGSCGKELTPLASFCVHCGVAPESPPATMGKN